MTRPSTLPGLGGTPPSSLRPLGRSPRRGSAPTKSLALVGTLAGLLGAPAVATAAEPGEGYVHETVYARVGAWVVERVSWNADGRASVRCVAHRNLEADLRVRFSFDAAREAFTFATGAPRPARRGGSTLTIWFVGDATSKDPRDAARLVDPDGDAHLFVTETGFSPSTEDRLASHARVVYGYPFEFPLPATAAGGIETASLRGAKAALSKLSDCAAGR